MTYIFTQRPYFPIIVPNLPGSNLSSYRFNGAAGKRLEIKPSDPTQVRQRAHVLENNPPWRRHNIITFPIPPVGLTKVIPHYEKLSNGLTIISPPPDVGDNVWMDIGRACGHFSNDLSVSHSHCTLLKRQGQWYLLDHSCNGTKVDGVLVKETDGRITLKNGAYVEVGSSSFTFQEKIKPESLNIPSATKTILGLGPCDKELLQPPLIVEAAIGLGLPPRPPISPAPRGTAQGYQWSMEPMQPIDPWGLQEVDDNQKKSLTALEAHPSAKVILQDRRLANLSRLDVPGLSFYFSPVILVNDPDDGIRYYVLAVVPEPVMIDGVTYTKLKTRFFFRSHSGGGWRACPYMTDGHLMKGVPVPTLLPDGRLVFMARHYTAETEPALEILAALEGLDRRVLEKKRDYIHMSSSEISHFIDLNGDHNKRRGKITQRTRDTIINGFKRATRYLETPSLEAFQQFRPGLLFNSGGNLEDLIQSLANLKCPPGALPDFAREPDYERHGFHHLLGDVTYRSFLGGQIDGHPVIWTMADTKTNIVWTQSLQSAASRINSYGVYTIRIDSGAITSKAVEYRVQASILQNTRFFQELPDVPHLSSEELESFRQTYGVVTIPDLEPVRLYKKHFPRHAHYPAKVTKSY